MQSKRQRFFTYGWVIPFATLATLMLIAFLVRLTDTVKSEVIAAWVQGVGSLLAIGVAVWIYAKQYQEKRADELAETRAFVQSIHTELSTLWNDWNPTFRATLQAGIKEKGFIIHAFPITPDSLIVYNATAAKVGKLDDAALRELIVQTYARYRGMIYAVQLNNAKLDELTQFEIMYDAADRERRLIQKVGLLRDYTAKLKEADADIEKLMTQLLPSMEQWLAEHPPR